MKRIRTLTEKGMEQYNEKKTHYLSKLQEQECRIKNVLQRNSDLDEGNSNIKKVNEIKCLLIEAAASYNTVYEQYRDFLTRTSTEESQFDTVELFAEETRVRKLVTTFMNDIDILIMKLSEKLSERSCSSKRSERSSVIAKKKSEAEAARIRAEFAKKQALISQEKARLEEEQIIEKARKERQQVVLETELNVLRTEEEAAVTAAEAEIIECASENNSEHRFELPVLPKLDPTEQVANFIKNTSASHDLGPLPLEPEPTTRNYATEYDIPIDITRYLLKKDLLLSRLTNFTDRPEAYRAWKESFKNVVNDLKATPSEETDLLIKYLGPESKRHAISLRSVYVSNPVTGCSKIWSRLDERYGSPELVKHAVMTKLNRLPKVNPKEPRQLYELVDILSEIEALKQDSKYSVQLGYFDSSEGVLPVVHKLPIHLQEKWVGRASSYKKNHDGVFPPFVYFLEFMQDMARVRNDPAFTCRVTSSNDNKSGYNRSADVPTCRKTEVDNGSNMSGVRCPIHKASHSLLDCRSFRAKPLLERKKIVKEGRMCFRCLDSNAHKAVNCKAKVKCSVCNSAKHVTIMHEYKANADFGLAGADSRQMSPSTPDGGEGNEQGVSTKCTQICGSSSLGSKSCAKIVLVDIYSRSNPSNRLRTYAIVDDQSNRSLAKSELFSKLNIDSVPSEYTLHTCSGPKTLRGRKAFDCVVEAVNGTHSYTMPPLLECSQIPTSREEIPTPAIASHFVHLQDIALQIPPLDENAEILLLIGRDVGAVHQVHDQVVGSENAPFAQRLGLGWVIIGQVCLGRVHHSDVVNCYKTHLLSNGRPSLFQPCQNSVQVKESLFPSSNCDCVARDLFAKTKQDDRVSLSIEDREFLGIMERDMRKDSCGHWTAPLPFRSPRPRLPNNRAYAFKRALLLQNSLRRDSKKCNHFISFMDQIIARGHAEIAPPLAASEECWYLPLFGVYHPKKPDQIRGVFDASAKFQDISLNDVLLQGPDMINNLLGILLRFRKDEVAVSGDIQQMFYSFLVDETDRNFLRFFWYIDNDPTKELVEYRMRAHVFGNKPSPSVANFGLQKTAQISESVFGADVRSFISSNFYVDDGLTSLPTADEAVDLMKRTQKALEKNGHIRLHKLASNSERVMAAFPQEDLAKDLANLDLSKDDIPLQRSLGLYWDLKADCFTFQVSRYEKPFTRRGVLSIINSLYDPLGLAAPVTISGKILLKEMTIDNSNWDDPLPEGSLSSWTEWANSLPALQQLSVPRTYFSQSISPKSHYDLFLFSDASEKAIASVAYLVQRSQDLPDELSFVMGKAKVAPSKGHTIPRLELCAAVLSVEIADFVLEHLDVKIRDVRYFTDSKVVLGYICNRTRRFFTYVANRVQRILNTSAPTQWGYVDTTSNPADVGTRGVSATQMNTSMWLKGPPERFYTDLSETSDFSLQVPDNDKEIRPDVTTLLTKEEDNSSSLNSNRFERFSSWNSLCRAFSTLIHVASSYNKSSSCVGWHLCGESLKSNQQIAQNLIVRVTQMDSFRSDMLNLEHGRSLSRNSSLLPLNPFLDENKVLRIGGRLNHSEMSPVERNPIIVPRDSHLATLLIRHFHEQVLHQGRHFTEGAVRSGGFWIIGGKRRISSLIFNCVICRKLRGRQQNQIMADLPADRVNPAPPFTYVGVDVFGPWSIVSRKTRGGEASSKRWGVLFTCLCIRAVHIELVSEMSSSAFINALRRFISIRGNVVKIRSDRGTNFIGSCENLGIKAISVEDGQVRKFLQDKQITWVFNPPHASHMGGVWERMIGVVRRILDYLLLNCRNLTHDVLATFMAEVCSIVNARPLVPLSSDSDNPEVLSPSILLTQKKNPPSSFNESLSLKDIYRAEWKRVQVLSDQFWYKWRTEFLTLLQSRKKWLKETPNLKKGDVVLMKDETLCRNEWPLGSIIEVFPSSDSKVRSVKVKVIKEGKSVYFTRPVTELVLLLSE